MEGWNSLRCAPHPSGQGRLLCSWFEKPASSSRYLCILQHWLGSFIAHGLSCQHPDPVIQCRMCCRGLVVVVVVYDLRESDRRWRTDFLFNSFFSKFPIPIVKILAKQARGYPAKPAILTTPNQPYDLCSFSLPDPCEDRKKPSSRRSFNVNPPRDVATRAAHRS